MSNIEAIDLNNKADIAPTGKPSKDILQFDGPYGTIAIWHNLSLEWQSVEFKFKFESNETVFQVFIQNELLRDGSEGYHLWKVIPQFPANMNLDLHCFNYDPLNDKLLINIAKTGYFGFEVWDVICKYTTIERFS